MNNQLFKNLHEMRQLNEHIQSKEKEIKDLDKQINHSLERLPGQYG